MNKSQKYLSFFIVFFSINILLSQNLTKQLKPIKENYTRINTIKNWSNVKQIEIRASSEGGTAFYYYLEGTLEKIVVKHFGEMGGKIIEYYFLNKRLSFSYDVLTEYKTHVSDPNFDLKKSNITEIRNYFEYDKLIKQLNNKDCGSPYSEVYLKEENNSIKSELIRILLELK